MSTKSEKMDTASDGKDRIVCVLKCPFCAQQYVVPHVYIFHLSAHIGYHSNGNRYRCTLCPVGGRDATTIAAHVERHHSKRSRHPVSSPLVRDVEADNLLEKDNIVDMLASSDDPQLRPTLPY